MSPSRRRPPARVGTGLFSVNSSDLLGYGISNLGNSGLVMGGSLDLKDEVEQQRPSSRRKRSKMEADTVSEQGDTDRYLKNVAVDASGEAARPSRRGPVPRQNSMVATHDGTPAKDIRGLWLELQSIQHQQAQLELCNEQQKRMFVEQETLIAQLQRGIQALQEDRSHLKAKIETIENHVHVLESNVVSSQQVAALQERLVKDLSEGKTATVVAEDVAAVSLSPPLDIAKHTLFQRPATHKGDQPRAAAAAAAVAAAAAAANAPATRAAGEEGADMTWHARAMLLAAGASGVAAATAAEGAAGGGGGNAAMSMPPTMPDVAVLPACGASGREHDASMDQLGPISQLQRDSIRLRVNDSLRQVQEPLDLESYNIHPHAEGLDTVKFDDNEDIKKLPKYDNFGSLSDLGSLFSGGPRSVDVRAASSRQPPSATLSITSPHPILKNVTNASVEHKDEGVTATVPSPAT